MIKLCLAIGELSKYELGIIIAQNGQIRTLYILGSLHPHDMLITCSFNTYNLLRYA